MSRAGIEPAGSSPLTRGKLAAISQLLVGGGLIPAHAGKTDKCLNGIQSGSAHPRSRGENSAKKWGARPTEGSSPLTRGKRSVQFTEGSATGLIPAHAGKTRPANEPAHPYPAHPRSRGENKRQDHCLSYSSGSSPLTRGKPRLTRGRVVRRGLIPAHAGKTRRGRCFDGEIPAHPRSRGENPLGILRAFRLRGSSPLTRGKLGDLFTLHAERRLIPAHAGKTRTCRPELTSRAAHPRSRGENFFSVVSVIVVSGSSPLTRGKPEVRVRRVEGRGLIPAHAGKTRLHRPKAHRA